MTIILQSHPSIDIAQELKGSLQALVLPIEVGDIDFTFVAVPEVGLIDLQLRSQVLVCARGLDSESAARHATMENPAVDIALRTNCKADDMARFGLFMSLAWSLGREALGLGEVAGFRVMKVTSNPIYNVDRLRSQNELLINQTVHFRASMEHD